MTKITRRISGADNALADRSFYLSTDGGATFTQKSTGPNITGIGYYSGTTLLSTPGFADVWWVVGNIYNTGAKQHMTPAGLEKVE